MLNNLGFKGSWTKESMCVDSLDKWLDDYVKISQQLLVVLLHQLLIQII